MFLKVSKQINHIINVMYLYLQYALDGLLTLCVWSMDVPSEAENHPKDSRNIILCSHDYIHSI